MNLISNSEFNFYLKQSCSLVLIVDAVNKHFLRFLVTYFVLFIFIFHLWKTRFSRQYIYPYSYKYAVLLQSPVWVSPGGIEAEALIGALGVHRRGDGRSQLARLRTELSQATAACTRRWPGCTNQRLHHLSRICHRQNQKRGTWAVLFLSTLNAV